MTRLSRIKNSRPGTEKPREFRCDKCRSRCTRSPDGVREYGHMTGCPDRPEEWPAGDHHVGCRDYIDIEEDGEHLVTDGGPETFQCEACGDATRTSQRYRYLPAGQSGDDLDFVDLCPLCSTSKDSTGLFKSADDQDGDS